MNWKNCWSFNYIPTSPSLPQEHLQLITQLLLFSLTQELGKGTKLLSPPSSVRGSSSVPGVDLVTSLSTRTEVKYINRWAPHFCAPLSSVILKWRLKLSSSLNNSLPSTHLLGKAIFIWLANARACSHGWYHYLEALPTPAGDPCRILLSLFHSLVGFISGAARLLSFFIAFDWPQPFFFLPGLPPW